MKLLFLILLLFFNWLENGSLRVILSWYALLTLFIWLNNKFNELVVEEGINILRSVTFWNKLFSIFKLKIFIIYFILPSFGDPILFKHFLQIFLNIDIYFQNQCILV